VKELYYIKYWYVIRSFYNSNGCCYINIKLGELKIQFLCLFMRLFKGHNILRHIYPLVTRLQLYFQTPSRPEAQQCRHPCTTTQARGVYPLPRSRGAGRRQRSMNCCSCSSSWLGSSGSENRTAKGPRNRAHSGRSGNWATTGKERYRRPQPHAQKLLGSVEIARCEKRHVRVQLRIC
jgi:hypothetical protein